MDRRLFLALALSAALLTGCFGSKPRTCSPTIAEPGSDPFCFVTSDGWAIQGIVLRGANAAGPTFVAIHGVNEDHASFATLASELKPLAAGIVLFDLRGHGKSTESKDGHTTWQQFSTGDYLAAGADLEKVIDAGAKKLGDHPLVLVGASIGANFAIRHSAENPAIDRAVVLLSPGVNYHDVTTLAAVNASKAKALFVASDEDRYAAQSVRDLSARSAASVHDSKIWLGSAHGTEILKIADERAFVVGWIRAHALA